jgi:5'-nucleotidase
MAKATATKKKPSRRRPVILVTNDDGVMAPGIRHLVEAIQDLGQVVVVAPDKPQSGMGHAITIGSPLRLHHVKLIDGVEAWSTSGTPVDCVKLAVDKVLRRKPDICLSGINHGATLIEGQTYVVSATAGSIAPISDLTTGDFPIILGVASTAALLILRPVAGGAAKP